MWGLIAGAGAGDVSDAGVWGNVGGCGVLSYNLIGDAGMIEFSRQIANGSLPACGYMYVSGNPGNAAQ